MNTILPSMRRSLLLQALALTVLLPSFVMLPSTMRANPSEGVVIHGAAEILQGEGFDPAFLEILQSSDRAIIEWGDFSIGEGETTRFSVPGATSATLNRVTGANLTQIYGNLISNGKLVLVNQNGIIVGPSGLIDAFGGFVGSTLDIDNNDFLNGGDDVFAGASGAGFTNFGSIISGGGDVILLGNFVDNQGTIGAVDGTIALGAGGDILVSQAGEAKISVRAAGPGGNVGVNNAGEIRGGAVELKAHGNVYAQAINNSGMIRATGASVDGNGRVILSARTADGKGGGAVVSTGEIRATNADDSGGFIFLDAGGEGSNLNIDGVVNANSLGGNGPGGAVSLAGETIALGSNADISADGTVGGVVFVGSPDETTSITAASGSKISANGSVGDGGTVIISGNNDSVLSLNGSIEARGAGNGGFISATGGTVTVGNTGIIDASGEVNGGFVHLEATNGVATVNGTVLADGATGNGGFINVLGSDGVLVGPNALISASGEVNGGVVLIESSDGEVTVNGTVNANGVTGEGGAINVKGAEGVNVGSGASLNANGGTNGGVISVDSPGVTRVEGDLSAVGGSGVGGSITVTGDQVIVAPLASLDASGAAGGGELNVGGSFQGGDANVRNSSVTLIGDGATLTADSANGDGGQVVVWSDGFTQMSGDLSARALGAGNGGLIEASGLNELIVRGDLNASSIGGQSGTALLDPGNIFVGGGAATITIATLNTTLQDNNTNVALVTGSGDVVFNSQGEGDNRDISVQWNTDASLSVYASGDVRFLNHARTAGGGSVNVVAGWTGTTVAQENALSADAILDPEGTFATVVGNGDYGANGGSVYINDAASGNRGVEVGSRYGNTNIAGFDVILAGSFAGNDRHAMIGFRDNGGTFYHSGNIRVGAGPDGPDPVSGIYTANPLLALVGVNEVTDTGGNVVGGANSGQVGVHMFDSNGVRTDTFIEYSDHFGRSDLGNWWWRTLDGSVSGSSGVGNNLPEMGAGTEANPADITVTARGSVELRSSTGSNNNGWTQIGHGGFAGDANVTRSFDRRNDLAGANGNGGFGYNGFTDGLDGGGNNNAGRPPTSETPFAEDAFLNMTTDAGWDQRFSMNFGNDNSYAPSIARLAPVYGSINVTAGADDDGNPTVGTGSVRVQAGQSASGSNNSSASIGHGGTFQSGTMHGDVNVRAGGRIDLLGGGSWNSHASIGHSMTGGEIEDDLRAGQGTLDSTAVDLGSAPAGVTFNGLAHYGDGGAAHKQFRYFRTTDDFRSGALRTGTVHGITGVGADVFTNLEGDIQVTSASGGIRLQAFQHPAAGTTRVGRSFVAIGHGGDVGLVQRWNSEGDILVISEGVDAGLTLTSGNRLRFYTQIGHHGIASNNINQARTSDYLIGDIDIRVAGDISMTAMGTVGINVANNGDNVAWTMIGHGGDNMDQQYKSGDITIETTNNGSFSMFGGAYGLSAAQVGHGGRESNGQVGGDYTRTFDGVTPIDRALNDTTDVSTFFDGTADIALSIDGDILLDHLPTGDVNGPANNRNYNMNRSPTLIGHGSTGADQRDGNALSNFDDKTGNITVITGENTVFGVRNPGDPLGIRNGTILSSTIVDNSITLRNGAANLDFYTRIGHGAGGNSDRQGNQVFTGDITVEAGLDVILDANAADQTFGFNPANNSHIGIVTRSPVAIGHGGTVDSDNLTGIGDISVTARRDLSLISGKLQEGSHAQIGHGFAGQPATNGNANDDGDFSGDISVVVGNNLTMTSNPDGLAYVLVGGSTNEYRPVIAPYTTIGHGGAFLSGQSVLDGNVDVFVGNDLTMTAANRTQGPLAGPFNNIQPDLIAGFTRIGNGNYGENAAGNVTGNINVRVANNLTITGGQGDLPPQAIPSDENQNNVDSFAQIGNGGARVDGDMFGNVNVRVGNDLVTVDGDGDDNNYVKIGHGDWMEDDPASSGGGDRGGNITVLAGNNISFDGTMVGHFDPAFSLIVPIIEDPYTTIIGASRNAPFFGGTGTLTTTADTLFTSGPGLASQLRFYVPGRSQNLMATGTRLNDATYVGTDADFATPTLGATRGVQAGFQREDEIYLQPDLWYDESGTGSPVSRPFGTVDTTDTAFGGVDITGLGNGSVAHVLTPGGEANNDINTPNAAPGFGTTFDAHGEVVYLGNGIGNTLGDYTIYYDVIGTPATPGGGAAPLPEVPFFRPTPEEPIVLLVPFIPFDFGPFRDLFTFELFDRDELSLYELIEGDSSDTGGESAGSYDGTDEEDARKRARYERQVSNWNVYYIYDIVTGQYNSLRLFGMPGPGTVNP